MRKFFQKEWFGIDFRELGEELSSREVAGEAFYSSFYREFFKRFSSYDDLPKGWRSSKKMVADLILRLAGSGDSLLSIGCGGGYIEHLLSKAGRDLTAIEPSEDAAKFLMAAGGVKLYNGYFPESLFEESADFDFAYMIAIDYTLEDDELLKLLTEAREYPLKKLLLVSSSVDSGSFAAKVISKVAGRVKAVLSAIGLYDRGQLWGYLRTPDELERIFKSAGFTIMETGFMNEQSFYIKGGT